MEDGGEEAVGGQPGLGGLGGLHHWMAVMAEHMAQDSSRQPFLWPKVNTGKTLSGHFSVSLCFTMRAESSSASMACKCGNVKCNMLRLLTPPHQTKM